MTSLKRTQRYDGDIGHLRTENSTFIKPKEPPGHTGQTKGKGDRKRPARFRTEEQPWGVDRLGREDQVRLRQENKMVKRSLRGLEAADRRGGFAGLEHPYASFLWEMEEAESGHGWGL